VISALYAYFDEPFDAFERRVEGVLARGMIWGIAREMLLSIELPKILFAILTSGMAALAARAIQLLALPLGWIRIGNSKLSSVLQQISAPLPRFASRTTAFERHLVRTYFGTRTLDDVRRSSLKVVLNAAELRTETAFRFGSEESGCWRFGKVVKPQSIATAVAASAAFPAFLPAIDRRLTFQRKGTTTTQRVLITDGGVYDNLGISCMLPGRTGEHSTNAHPVDFIIACDASQGLPPGTRRPYFWGTRMLATIFTIHRRVQSMTQDLLHRMAASGEIRGFLMPYLGMLDERLPHRPADLVPREDVVDYPTNFNPMSRTDIDRISKRGEQLMSALLEEYAPYL
jgi:NTE family protein